MSKTIKLQDKTYHRLEEVREKRETFSEAIDRLLNLHAMMGDVSKTLGPSHYLMERPLTDARAKETIDYGGRTAKLPYKDKQKGDQK